MTESSSAPDAERMLLPVLFFGVLMGALDIAIVGPALPAIRSDFEVDEAALSWVFSIFTLFAVISAAPLARLSDRFGRRDLYIASVAVFTLGSVLVAVAPNFAFLIVARAVQASGAGGIFPVASAVIGDVVPEARRGRALGLIGAVFGIAFLLGPILGGLLLPLGWRSLFLINIPIGIALIIAAARVLPRAGSTAAGKIDVAGIFLLAATLGCLALGFNGLSSVSSGDASDIVAVLGPLLFAVVLLAVLVRVERAAQDPVLPPELFASRQLRLIGAIAVVAGVVEAGMIYLPTVAVSGLGVSDARAAWMMLPLVLALAVASPAAGTAVDRWNSRVVIRVGLLVLVVGLLVFSLASLSVASFYLAGGLVGAGLASLLGAPLRHAALAATPEAHRGIGQGMMSLALHTGQISGAAAIGALMAAQPAAELGFSSAMFWLACLVVAAGLISARLRASS